MLALNVGGLPDMSTVPGISSVPVQISDINIEEIQRGNIQVGNVQIQTDENGRTNVQVGDDVQVQTDGQGRANVRAGNVEVNANGENDSITIGGMKFGLERAATSVFSFGELEQSIERRKQELEREVASTTSDTKDILENVNQVRLAVHALLASKDMLGGIGRQVSQIAQQMNDSVATTTIAESKIQSRGFFSRLLFGGDSTAAETISEEAVKNQGYVQKLTGLLDQVNVPADVQATLEAQIDALQAEQARLQDLAEKEKGRWGIFSWRFF